MKREQQAKPIVCDFSFTLPPTVVSFSIVPYPGEVEAARFAAEALLHQDIMEHFPNTYRGEVHLSKE